MTRSLVKWMPLVILMSLMCTPPIMDYTAFSMTFIPLLFLVWLLAIWQHADVLVSSRDLFIFAVIILAQLLLWLTGGVHNTEAMLLGLVWLSVAFLLWLSVPYVVDNLDFYLCCYVGAAIFWAVVAGFVWFGFTDGEQLSFFGFSVTHIAQSKPTGPFANGNVFGIMMVCAWLIATVFWLRERKYTTVFALISFFFLVWVFASMSRGAWVALVSVGFLVFVHLLLHKKYKNLTFFLCSAVFAWVIADSMVSFVDMDINLSSRAEEIVSLGAREVLYPSIFEIWKSSWLLGVGLGNISAHYLTAQAAALTYLPLSLHGIGTTTSAHNHLLYVLSTMGVVGFLAWSLVSLALWRNFWKVRFSIHHPAWLALALAVILWIQGLFNITMNEALPFFLFFTFLRLGLVHISGQSSTVSIVYLNREWLNLVAGILIVALTFYSYTTVHAWRLYEQMVFTTKASERGEVAGKALSFKNNIIYPYIMNTIVHDFILSQKGDVTKWHAIKPNIEYGLLLQEWPGLYQALFYTEVLDGNWGRACELGLFLKQQRWENDKNIVAYDKACQSEKVDDFTIGW